MSEIITSGEMRDLWADIKNNTEQLDIDLSALRDSITASGENATTLNNLYNKIEETRVLLNNIAAEDFATESTLDEIRNYIYSLLQQTATEDKQDALIAKDFATQTTLAAILAKMIEAPATEAKQTALAALIGEVQASPTANTLLARLKSLEDKIGTIDGVLNAIVDGSAPAATQLTGSYVEIGGVSFAVSGGDTLRNTAANKPNADVAHAAIPFCYYHAIDTGVVEVTDGTNWVVI